MFNFVAVICDSVPQDNAAAFFLHLSQHDTVHSWTVSQTCVQTVLLIDRWLSIFPHEQLVAFALIRNVVSEL